MDVVDFYLFHAPNNTLLYLVLVGVLLLYIYPVHVEHWSRDRGDTGAILGTLVGVLLGHCALGPTRMIWIVEIMPYKIITYSAIRFNAYEQGYL